jgi:RNA polymerase primary sigma factor
MPTDASNKNSAELIAHALDLGRRNREKLQVAIDAFRALSNPDRLQFLALVEEDIVAASSGEPAVVEAVPTQKAKPRVKEELGERRFQRQHVIDVLERNDWNIAAVSRDLNLPRARVNNLIRAHQIKRGAPKQKRAGRPPLSARKGGDDDDEPEPASEAPIAEAEPEPEPEPEPELLLEKELEREPLWQTKRLTALEEGDLARSIQACERSAWDYLLAGPQREEILAFAQTRGKPITTAESAADLLRELDPNAALLKKLAEDVPEVRAWVLEAKRHRDRYAAANQGLVHMLARKYLWSNYGLTDLVQEGNFGLFRAVATFDPARGTKFSTHAVWWIRHAIGRAVVDRADTIRLPAHMQERLYRLRRATSQLETKLGRSPTLPELAAATGFNTDQLQTGQELIRTLTSPISLETPRGENHNIFLRDVVADPTSRFEPIDAQLMGHEEKAAVRKALVALEAESPKYALVLRHRFGVNADEEPLTLEEIGQKLEVTRERARQIEKLALPRFSRHLRAALPGYQNTRLSSTTPTRRRIVRPRQRNDLDTG